MSAWSVERTDRRQRRRRETISEVLDVALQVMAEQGVAGLSLGEVARRMGIRPPSLYVYFDSKNALYDAIFARGWGVLGTVMEPIVDSVDSDVRAYLLRNAEAFVRWSVEHPAYSQLMFWRPVPGYEPSPEAYEPAVRLLERGRTAMVALRDRGALRADADVDELARVWTIVISGVVSQQLSNAPTERFEDGRFTTLLPQVVEMYLRSYTPLTHVGGPSHVYPR
jgi:AcrR family transcriptional regulator